MKVLLIHHEGAGGGEVAAATVAGAIGDLGCTVQCLARHKAGASAIGSAKPDLVAVAGGDGTVAAILALLPDRSVPVGIVPTGTANNIAGSLGIGGDPEKVMAGWDIDRRLRFDIGNAQGPWGCRTFAEGVGFGAFADSLRIAPEVEGPARLRSGRRAMRDALRGAAPLPLDIAVDGRPVAGDLLLVEILNVALTGPHLPFAPRADCGDGKLDIACLVQADRDRMEAWLRSRGRAEMPTRAMRGKEIVVRGGGVTMRIDDECRWLEPESEVTIRLEGEPVQILAPPDRSALAGSTEKT